MDKIATLAAHTFVAFDPDNLIKAVEDCSAALQLGDLELAYEKSSNGRQAVREFSRENFLKVFDEARTASPEGVAGSFLVRDRSSPAVIGVQWQVVSAGAWKRVVDSSGVSANIFSVNFSYDQIANPETAPRIAALLGSVSDRLKAEYGYVRGYGNKYDRRPLRHLGIAGGLPGLFWANYFGQSVWSVIGERLVERVGAQFVSLPSGAHVLVLDSTEEGITRTQVNSYIVAIGEEYFAPSEKADGRGGSFSLFSRQAFSLALKLVADGRRFSADQQVFPMDFSGIRKDDLSPFVRTP